MIATDTIIHLADVRIHRLTNGQLVNTIIDTVALLSEGMTSETRDRETQYLERLLAVAKQRRLTIPTC